MFLYDTICAHDHFDSSLVIVQCYMGQSVLLCMHGTWYIHLTNNGYEYEYIQSMQIQLGHEHTAQQS